MTRLLKFFLPLLIVLMAAVHVQAQMVADPTSWSFEVKKKGDNKYELVVQLTLQPHWHIWSLNPGGDGLQIPPSLTLDRNPMVTRKGSLSEKGEKKTEEMEGVDGKVSYFENKVTYTLPITVSGNTTITGVQGYQVCDDKMCLPPKKKKFSLKITDAVSAVTDSPAVVPSIVDTVKKNDSLIQNTAPVVDTMGKAGVDGAGNTTDGNEEQKKGSLVELFFASIGGGLLALVTPCVFSMLPITVSFFTKRSKTRKEGIRNAIYYALSIIIIFTALGVFISLVFGGNALNAISTNWIANLIFFIIFLIFGVSFLGAFEITLPSSWTGTTDAKAGLGSFGGIFFMALTLVIVSFSCTGPIMGSLVILAAQGAKAGPAVGMFGFSIGLALPFALFAIFPSWLNKLASSGGWLNQVKVVLGFLELMLALKFLSNADLAKGWRLLDREVFIAIWIVLAILLGIYLLGKLKLSHDDATVKNVFGQEYVSVFRLFLAIASFTFAVYLVPGMWGAPLKAMSAFLPPMGTHDFIVSGGSDKHSNEGPAPVKYVKQMAIYEPEAVKKFGLVTYYDYDEALAASKILGKPVMLDFTGINCQNCRKMEGGVWSNPEVARRMREDFVVASLYVDFNNEDLPVAEQFFSKELNADVVTVGDKNAHLQASRFGANSQPYYFFVDGDGKQLIAEGYSYDPDPQHFINHLEKVKQNYEALHP